MNDCKFFGVRTIEREGKAKCQNCKASNLELFKKCTRESNITMGTSVLVDGAGETIFVPPKVVSDTKLLYEKHSEVSSPQKKVVVSDTSESKQKRTISSRVKGLAIMCRKLKSEGKSDEEIVQEVANKYADAGKSEKEATGKAKSWVKNMNWDGVKSG